VSERSNGFEKLDVGGVGVRLISAPEKKRGKAKG